ncbi:MAG: hypothetical protein MRK01_11240 [Candidatus Scalindua sp.]|nr:hypothetical protein [Candidatus Scalindua sp.]
MSSQHLTIAFLIATVVAFLIYKDALKNGYSKNAALGWMAGVFLVMIVFLPAYLIVTYIVLKGGSGRRTEILTPCEHCRKHYTGNPNYCPHCGHLVRKVW